MLGPVAALGGATAATVDTIQKEDRWSPAGIGLLSQFWQQVFTLGLGVQISRI